MNIYKYLISFFIAPHGMTDIIYCYKNNNYNNLIKSYGTGIISSLSIPNKYLEPTLLISSSIHFRNDFKIKPPINLLASSYFVSNARKIGLKKMILYLSFIHVPNHYINNYELIKNNKDLFKKVMIPSTILIGLSSQNILSNQISNNILNLHSYKSKIIIGLINSHIIFQEFKK